MCMCVRAQEWIHLETQAIAAMNFRFSSKGDPMNYVSRLAGNMQTYPPEHAVAGPSLRYDYDPGLVRELLGYLVPGNMLLVVITRDFKGKTDKVGTRGLGGGGAFVCCLP